MDFISLVIASVRFMDVAHTIIQNRKSINKERTRGRVEIKVKRSIEEKNEDHRLLEA